MYSFSNIKNTGLEGDNLDLWIWNFLQTMLKLITYSSFATRGQKPVFRLPSRTMLFFRTSDILCLCIREASLLAPILHLCVVNSRGQAYNPWINTGGDFQITVVFSRHIHQHSFICTPSLHQMNLSPEFGFLACLINEGQCVCGLSIEILHKWSQVWMNAGLLPWMNYAMCPKMEV